MSRLLAVLTEATGLSGYDLARVIATAPHRYKQFTIPKRQGGTRLIAQPAREVKAMQRAIVRAYLSDLPIHPAVTAYEPGTSIRENASRHATNGPILKLDIADFFPSIRADDFLSYCAEHSLFDDESERIAATKILFHRPKGARVLRLAIGAPSSPHISNLLMYHFDRAVASEVGDQFVTYTRYADDLTFSAKRTGYLNPVEKIVRKVLREIGYPRLKLNDSKKVVATKKYHRQVTGLVLSNDGRVSLGRKRKRELRAALHHFAGGKLEPKAQKHLHGMMAFAKDAEPDFYARMQARYGRNVFEALSEALREADE
ncbi:MAG: RNA-directed DNA polymerase [Sphingomonas sp.]|nr:RNA-directed DNA polymerase [Sphingomonas sp.]